MGTIFKIKQLQTPTIIAVMVVTGGLVFAVFYFQTNVAEAVSERAVGSVSGTVVPYATGGEYITFSYGGVGVLDLEGWTVTSDNGSTYTVGDLVVANGETVRACQVEDNFNCNTVWLGGELFDDVSGVITVRNASGVFVYDIEYNDLDTTNDNGSSFSGNGVYTTAVYGKPDKIDVCHLNGKGEYTKKQSTAGSFMNGYLNGNKAGHSSDIEDIIAPFFYAKNSTARPTYFPGMNVDKVEMIATGC